MCALDRIRTYGLLLRRQTLYPLSYEGAAPGKSASTFWDVNELIRNYPHRHKPSVSEEGVLVDSADAPGG